MPSEPYHYGFRPWSSVINEATDNVTGGIDKVVGGLRTAQARGEAREKENRALHPLAQKYFEEVSAGRMTPAEASVAAHQEIDANNNGIPDAQEGGGFGTDPATVVGNSAEAGPETEMPFGEARTVQVPDDRGGLGQIRSSGLSTPAPQPPRPEQREPLRNRDIPALQLMTQHQAATRPRGSVPISDEQFEKRENIKAGAKIKVEDRKGEIGTARDEAKAANKSTLGLALEKARAEGRMTELQAKLVHAKEIEWQKHLDRIAALDNRLATASTAVEVAQIHSEASRYSADIRTLGSLRASLGQLAQDEDLLRDATYLEEKTRGGYKRILAATSSGGSPETPPIPKAGSNPTSKAKSFKMKFPDGKVYDVPADKVDAAKKKGGVLNG